MSRHLVIIAAIILIVANLAFSWEMTFTVKGEPCGGYCWQNYYIGEDTVATFIPAPPQWFISSMWGYFVERNGGYPQWSYFRVIYPYSPRNTWIFYLDPNGNLQPPIARTDTIYWDATQLPPEGNFSFLDYFTGQVIIRDMRTIDTLIVTGAHELYYKIVHWSNPVDEESAQISCINLPNPFNPATEISFSLPEASDVKLIVYDIIGREVAKLVDGFVEVGVHTVQFDGSNLASGIYFYHLTAGKYTAVKKMMLVK